MLSRFFGREVELSAAADNGYTIDNWHPDEEDYDPEGHRDEVVESTLGAAVFTSAAFRALVPEGAFFDAYPLSVLRPRPSTGSASWSPSWTSTCGASE